MKKIKFEELVELLADELSITLDVGYIGDVYDLLLMRSESMFEDQLDYNDYAASYEADTNLRIECDEQTALAYHSDLIKQGRERDLELLINEEIVSDHLENYFSSENVMYLTSYVDIFDELKTLQAILKERSAIVKIYLEDASNPTFLFECELNSEKLTSHGAFIMRTENRSELFYTALRFMENFQHCTSSKLENLNVDIFIESDYHQEKKILTGKDLINEYLSGKKKHLFEIKTDFLELLEQYPIIMEVAPKQIWQDREIVLAFLHANIKYATYVENAFNKTEKSILNTSSSMIRTQHIEDYKNAFIDRCPPALYQWFHDQELMGLIIESPMFRHMEITKEIYDEARIKLYLEKHPKMIIKVYQYWCEELKHDPKMTEHIKRKYRLYDKTPFDVLAGYKAYDMIATFKKTQEYLKYLSFTRESSIFIKDIWEDLTEEVKSTLLHYCIPLADIVKHDLSPMDPLVDYIIEFCPEPGAFLSDEIILLKDLNPYEKDKKELCENCMKCDFVHIRFR